MNKLIIPGHLPTMNEIIKAAKSHPIVYRNMKKQYTELVAWSAKGLPRIERANFTITWFCSNQRVDKDNVTAGQKFVFDGLVIAGVLDNDGWKQIGDVTHRFEIDRKNPRIEVEIEILVKALKEVNPDP